MADRYWVGGTATWDGTAGTKWATTSGGTGGETVPGTSDDVFFDAASGANTVTLSGSRSSKNLNFSGFTGTFTGTGTVSCRGNLVLDNSATYTNTGTITMGATTTGFTITTDGVSLPFGLTFDGVGGGWTLNDALTLGTNNNTQGRITLTRGTLDTNGKTLDTWSFSANNSNTKTLTLGASLVKIRSGSTGSTDGWVMFNTGTTVNANTSTIRFTSTTSAALNGSTLTYNNIETSTIATGFSVRGAFTCNNFTMTGVVGDAQAQMTLSDPFTVTGTLSISGDSTTDRLWVRSVSTGEAITITAATTSLSNVDFTDITAAGAGAWSGTSLGNAEGNTGITFTSPTTRYWVGGGGTWSDTTHWASTSGGSGGQTVPLCHDDVVFDANSFTGAGTVTGDVVFVGKNITLYGDTDATYDLDNTTYRVLGSMSVGEGSTYSFGTFVFGGRDDYTLTTNGVDMGTIDVTATQGYTGGEPLGTLLFADNFYSSSVAGSGVECDDGAIDFNGFDVTVGSLRLYPSNGTRFTLGDGIITVRDYIDFEDFTAEVYTPLEAQGSTIILTGEGSNATVWTYADSAITFTFDNIYVTDDGIEFDRLGSSHTTTINTLTVDGHRSTPTVYFDTIGTHNIGMLRVFGTEDSMPLIRSLVSANDASVNITNAEVYYARIQDINSTNAITVYNSTNVSGNTNITFGTATFTPTPRYPVAFSELKKHAATFTNVSKNASTFTNITKS